MFKLNKIFVCGMSVLLASCSGSAVRELERSQLSNQEDIGEIRSMQAEHTAAITQLQSEVRQLTGKIEELAYQQRGQTQELEQRLSAVSSRVPPPEGVPVNFLDQDEASISRNSGKAADQFKSGLQQIRTGDFEGAKTTFASFVERNPNTAYTDNALFWVGIANEKLGQYDRAIVSYSEIFQKFPAEDRVPPALLRLGDCFVKIGSRQDAALSYQMLVDDYPKSAQAKEAQEKLKTVKPQAKGKATASADFGKKKK